VVAGVVVAGVVVVGVVVVGGVVVGVVIFGFAPYMNWIPAMSSGPIPLRKSKYVGYMISTIVLFVL